MGRVWTLTPKYHKPKEVEPEPIDPIEAYRLTMLGLPMISRADAEIMPVERVEAPDVSREHLIALVIAGILLFRE